MKPTTRLQFRIEESSKDLPDITGRQLEWAKKQALDKMFIYDRGRQKWCGKCGHVWTEERTNRKRLRCPNCGKLSYRYSSGCESQKQVTFISTISVVKGIQLIRCYEIILRCKKGGEPVFNHCEVARNWITPDLKMTAYTRTQTFKGYCWTSNLTLRGTFTPSIYRRINFTISTQVCPIGKRFIPELARIGADRCTDFSYEDIERIKSYPIFETALKLGYGKAAERLMDIRRRDLLPALKIAIRHGYHINNASMWADTLEMLLRLKKDIRNPVFVCPENLKEAHDKWMKIIRAKDERIQRERLREQQIWEQERLQRFKVDSENNEAEYRKKKGKYLGIKIEANGITMSVIPTVADFLKIGSDMHICIFTNEYYKRDNSLIIIAKKRDKIQAVMELALDTGKCIQSRTKCNEVPKDNNMLVKMLESNAGIFLQAGNKRNNGKQR